MAYPPANASDNPIPIQSDATRRIATVTGAVLIASVAAANLVASVTGADPIPNMAGAEYIASDTGAEHIADDTGTERIADDTTRKPKRFLRLPQVQERVAHSRAWIYREIRRGEFPGPIVIGDNGASVWIEDEIIAWQEAQIAKSRARPGRRRGRSPGKFRTISTASSQ